VQYTAHGWLEKNRGRLDADLHALLSGSRAMLVEQLFQPRAADERKPPTVGGTFRASLRALSATVLQTNQHFVRCAARRIDASRSAALIDACIGPR
jgi:myosin-5